MNNNNSNYIKKDEHSLAVFERKVLRQKRDCNTETHERKTYRELRNLLGEPNVVAAMMSKRISWVKHVWRAQEQVILVVVKWILKSERPLGRPRQRRMGRIQSDLNMLGTNDGEDIAKS